MQFTMIMRGGGKLAGNDIIQIESVTVDEIVQENVVTLIKMDVEGSELESLKGCKKTIERCKPRLAISIYHKPEDIFTIPNYILKLNDSYKFRLRHYSSSPCETVLYAE